MRLYFTAVSFEERCSALSQSLANREADDEVLVLEFRGYENVGPYLHNRSIVRSLLRVKGYSPITIEGDLNRPIEALKLIDACLSKQVPDEVVIDVSTLPRHYLFGICRLLAARTCPTWIRYYKPSDYGTELSRGVGSVKPIAGFEGHSKPSSEVVLAIILGFEGYKALQAWERIGPTRVVAMIGDPPYDQKFLDLSLRHNEELLTKVKDVERINIPTFDVLDAKKVLQELYKTTIERNRDASFVLCPLGTKLQSLAAFAFAYLNTEVSVIYVSSLKYFSGDYSKGYETTFTELSLQSLLSKRGVQLET